MELALKRPIQSQRGVVPSSVGTRRLKKLGHSADRATQPQLLRIEGVVPTEYSTAAQATLARRTVLAKRIPQMAMRNRAWRSHQ